MAICSYMPRSGGMPILVSMLLLAQTLRLLLLLLSLLPHVNHCTEEPLMAICSYVPRSGGMPSLAAMLPQRPGYETGDDGTVCYGIGFCCCSAKAAWGSVPFKPLLKAVHGPPQHGNTRWHLCE